MIPVGVVAADGAKATVQMPTPIVGASIQKYSDLLLLFARKTYYNNPAALTPELQTVSTPNGPGFQFSVSDATDVAAWDATMKAVLAKASIGPVMGQTQQWDFYVYLPSQKIVTAWNGGVLWEFHTTSYSGHNISLDNTGRGPGNSGKASMGGKLSWRFAHLSGSPLYPMFWGPAVVFDTWQHFQINVRWSTGADGFYKLSLNGTQFINAAGPTVIPGDGVTPYLQFGFYGDIGNLAKTGAVPSVGTNQVTIAGITRR